MIFGRRDLERLLNPPAQPVAPEEMSSGLQSAIYVIKGPPGRCKIGITGNTDTRLPQLSTGSAFPLSYAWIGIPDGDADAIEDDAHNMLDPYRRNGEWFEVPPDMAVGAVCAAAHRRGRKILEVTPELAERIRIASEAAHSNVSFKPHPLDRAVGLLWRGAMTCLMAAIGVGIAVGVWLLSLIVSNIASGT